MLDRIAYLVVLISVFGGVMLLSCQAHADVSHCTRLNEHQTVCNTTDSDTGETRQDLRTND